MDDSAPHPMDIITRLTDEDRDSEIYLYLTKQRCSVCGKLVKSVDKVVSPKDNKIYCKSCYAEAASNENSTDEPKSIKIEANTQSTQIIKDNKISCNYGNSPAISESNNSNISDRITEILERKKKLDDQTVLTAPQNNIAQHLKTDPVEQISTQQTEINDENSRDEYELDDDSLFEEKHDDSSFTDEIDEDLYKEYLKNNYHQANSSDDNLIRCDGCGGYFFKNELRKCKTCGKVLCPTCRKKHFCLPKPHVPHPQELFSLGSNKQYEEVIKCDNCKRTFPKSELKKCSYCGAVLCKDCQKIHECMGRRVENNRREKEIAEKREINESRKHILFSVGTLLVVLIIIGIFLFGGYCFISSLFNSSSEEIPTDIPYPPTPIPTIIKYSPSSPPSVTTVTLYYTPSPTPTIYINLKKDPHIVLDKSVDYKQIKQSQTISITEGVSGLLHVIANSQVYYGAKSSNSKKLTGSYDVEQRYVSMTLDSEQDEFYDGLLEQFNAYKSKYQLTSDEFVDMVTAYVQGIPYDYYAEDLPRYPVITALDNCGDCDEKSMLLAGLLSKAGYDVVLFDFDDISSSNGGHMAVGIRTNDDSAYRDGYSFIETTGDCLIGYEGNAKDGLKYAGYYKIGSGRKTYNSATQAKVILNYVDLLDQKVDNLKANVNRLSSSPDINRYNAAVNEYNKWADIWNYFGYERYNGMKATDRASMYQYTLQHPL